MNPPATSSIQSTEFGGGHPQSINVHDSIDCMFANFENTLTDRRLEVQLDISDDLSVHSGKEAISIIFRNLIDNAGSYADANTKFVVASEANMGRFVLIFSNRTDGFPVERIAHIFDRFW